ncbi:MAG: hypothetical protein IE909_04370 [Campylobacterales bacterium]|nr:hypothetical protein [Campylobacterales bacterium]
MQYNLLDNSLFDLINFLNNNIQQIDSQLCIVTNQNQIDTYGYDSFVDLASQYQLKFLIPVKF